MRKLLKYDHLFLSLRSLIAGEAILFLIKRSLHFSASGGRDDNHRRSFSQKLFWGILFLTILTSCEKDITVKLPPVEEKIMVEGFIENGQKATVFLTKNAPYFATFNNVGVEDYVISNAFITINDGTLIDTLKEAAPFFPGLYISKLVGEIGKTYNLKVIAENKTATATTTIQQPIPITGIRYTTTNNGFGAVWTKINDPSSKEFYRLLHKSESKEQYDSPPTSVFRDDTFNGQEFEFGDFFKKDGDSTYIKICVIDEAAFNFINNFEIDARNRGNPFANPIVIRGNVHGGLGLWCGYGASYALLKNE